jgi:hypothetical protein
VSLPPLPDNLWLWLAIAGLGLFHGINPTMGWLFAVALLHFWDFTKRKHLQEIDFA